MHASGGGGYSWSPTEGLNNPQSPSPIASPIISTTYTVEMTDSIGCIATGQVKIFVETSAYVPNLFTPNGDSKNDRLKIYGLEDVSSISFKIFNRTGSMVYETSDAGELEPLNDNSTTELRYENRRVEISFYY